MTDALGAPTSNPSEDNVVLELIDSKFRINRWKEYAFTANYLQPCAAFHFVVANDELSEEQRDSIKPGAEVRCTVNGAIQGSGRIDRLTYTGDRDSGSEIHIEGRDKLGWAVDCGIDPLHKFTSGMSLLQVLTEVFAPFGFTADQIGGNNELNRGVQSKNLTGVRTRTGKKGTKISQRFLRYQLRPYPREHALEFAARVCQREGFWLSLSADGQSIICSTPEYNQAPSFRLQRVRGDRSQGNNFKGTVQLAIDDQPSVIVCDGFSGRQDFGPSRLRCIAINPSLSVDNSAVLQRYANSGSLQVGLPFTGIPIVAPFARPLFLHDDDAKTPDQLEAFALRELSLRLRKSLTVNASVYGHGQNNKIWTVDTVATLDDDLSNVHEDLWILERTLRKSRSGGTTTDLQCIRLFSMVFDPNGNT